MVPLTGVVLAVYRKRNASVVSRLLADIPAGWTAALWALDAVAPELAEHTVGVGPGTKFDLLNRLYAAARLTDHSYVITADDDLEFRHGSLLQLLQIAERAKFSLCQPAHAARSPHSHGITRRIARSRARRTTFVEIGPLVVIAPSARHEVLPFPDDIGMGWGLEFAWHDLTKRGHLLGIVDATPIKHLGKVGVEYDDSPERARLAAIFAERGITDWQPIQHVLGTWRPWHRQPPWLRLP